MKISHLTFGQLYKLSHATTIIRVMRARDSALRREWDDDSCSLTLEPFSQIAAASLSPEVAARYDRMLALLRGPEVKQALRDAAATQEIPYVPGAARELCRFRWSQLAYAHANIVYTFCKLSGAVVHVHTEGLDVVVRVDTTPLGIAALNYKPGLKWKTICQECAIENLRSPFDIFWWLTPIMPLGENDRLNPAVWPCNTPDVAAIAESLVTRAN